MVWLQAGNAILVRLNAPYGARCFLTVGLCLTIKPATGLNAPYGAQCFLTDELEAGTQSPVEVLMHLMALGAF